MGSKHARPTRPGRRGRFRAAAPAPGAARTPRATVELAGIADERRNRNFIWYRARRSPRCRPPARRLMLEDSGWGPRVRLRVGSGFRHADGTAWRGKGIRVYRRRKRKKTEVSPRKAWTRTSVSVDADERASRRKYSSRKEVAAIQKTRIWHKKAGNSVFMQPFRADSVRCSATSLILRVTALPD